MRQFPQRETFLTPALVLLICVGGVNLSRAENPLEDKLNMSISMDKGVHANLKDVLKFLADRYKLAIQLDEDAFKKELKIDKVGDKSVHLRSPVSGVRLGLVLDMLVKQVGGRYEIKSDHIEIAPLSKARTTVSPKSSDGWVKASKRTRERLEKPVTLDKGIDGNTPLQDVVEFLSDRYGVAIIVDATEFKNQKVNDNVEDAPVSLRPQKEVKLAEVLKQVFKQVGGSYEIVDGAIIVAPPKKKNSI